MSTDICHQIRKTHNVECLTFIKFGIFKEIPLWNWSTISPNMLYNVLQIFNVHNVLTSILKPKTRIKHRSKWWSLVSGSHEGNAFGSFDGQNVSDSVSGSGSPKSRNFSGTVLKLYWDIENDCGQTTKPEPGVRKELSSKDKKRRQNRRTS